MSENRMLNQMLEEFALQYPRTTKEVSDTFASPTYNKNTISYFVISLALLMCKMKNGHYKSYQRNKDDLPIKVIDTFGVCYTKQFIHILNQLISIGEENSITKMKSLNPDGFFKKMIDQFAD